MTMIRHHRRRRRSFLDGVDLLSLALLFVALVATTLALIGIAVRGTTPLVLILPVALGVWSILSLRR